MEGIRGWVSSPTELAIFTIVPLATLYTLITSNSRKGASSEEAPYLISGFWPISLISHVRALLWSDTLVQRGYKQYDQGMFKIPMLGHWVTSVSPKYIGEVIHAPESSLSLKQIFNTQLLLDLLVGPALSKDRMHITLIRILNKNLDEIYTEIRDETEFAIEQELAKGKEKDGWISVKAYSTVESVVLSLNNRAFIGLPECRNPEWIKATTKDSIDMALRTWFLKVFPESKRATINSYICRYYSKPFEASVGIVTRLVNERLDLPENQRSNDLLSWILTRIPEQEPDPRVICGVFQLVSNVAQGTVSMSFGHALYHLVAHPENIAILREEILGSLEDGELTRDSLDHMHKLDSFLRETQRLSVIGNFAVGRVAMHDFTFSNGIRVPAGDMVQVMAMPLHHDAAFYPDPLEFKPWRFYELAQAEAKDAEQTGESGKGASKYDMVVPSETFLAWGLGRGACPGRWYAAMVMKHLMAYLILNYDMKLPDSAKGKRPADLCVASVRFPNSSAQVLFRSRKADHTE